MGPFNPDTPRGITSKSQLARYLRPNIDPSRAVTGTKYDPALHEIESSNGTASLNRINDSYEEKSLRWPPAMGIDARRIHRFESHEGQKGNDIQNRKERRNGTATLESSSCKDRILYTQDSEYFLN
ncbi:hypothetical protein EV421DRAFT_1738419 [Armillaria borealis]|uniref:Uncharacterized protein n=1 Tax=Armillaria borealis TaxID=47425 RepID=A0AA39JC87_9AGAR|nr:hypothetical protein EV421DRAFT_1738419 [Armillaria borealis]